MASAALAYRVRKKPICSAIFFARRYTMHYSYELFLKELGVKLKQMRQDRGWSLRHMVVQHRFHITHWQSFEKGKGMSMPSLLRVCEVFDISLEGLVAGLGIVDEGNPRSEESAAQRSTIETASRKTTSSVSTRPVPTTKSPKSSRRASASRA